MNEAVVSTDSALGVIGISGADAGDFLRNQLTNDVLRLGSDRHFLAAWCDPKGRVLMLARVALVERRYLLIVPRSLIAALMRRLQMYVLRAQVTLTNESERFCVAGVFDDGDELPGVNSTTSRDGLITLGLPATTDGTRRALLLADEPDALPANALSVDEPAWQLGQIDAGVPQIVPETQSQFVPQMLNLHWLLAVDFAKGCYPGQEIVARLHYRGRLTRHVQRLRWTADEAPAAGSLVITAADANAGMVLQAVSDGSGQGRLLAVVKTAQAYADDLHCGPARLQKLDLPYATPA